MRFFDIGGVFQIGYGAGHFQYPVVGPGRKVQFGHRRPQQFLPGGGNLTEFAQMSGQHVGVGKNLLLFGKPLSLNSSCRGCSCANLGGSFGTVPRCQLLKLHGGNFDMNVDSIQKWAGDFRDVALDFRRRAVATAGRVAKKTARAGVSCCE